MKLKMKFFWIVSAYVLVSNMMVAQPLTTPSKTESSRPMEVIDGLYEPEIVQTTSALAYDDVKERDVFWQKKIWRVIDVNEKMNQVFSYPQKPFINIILEAAKQGTTTLYYPLDDKFTQPMTRNEAANIGFSIDTIIVFDPVTMRDSIVIVINELNWREVKRFRLKEVWFFDVETSMMRCRIIGIAPLISVYDEQGNFKYEKPMFWAYFPELRRVLATEPVFNALNDRQTMSWEDLFEMRYFASYIYQEANVLGNRLQDVYSGVDLLLEADKIKNEIFNFEHDLWSL